MIELRKRTGINYGEDIPLERALIIHWCVSQVEQWATLAGMETFREEEREGHMVVVLGGKILVVDIDFSIDRSNPLSPILGIISVKTSYAVPNGTASSTTDGSISLDGFLAEYLGTYVREVQKEEEDQDTMEAARLGSLIAEHMKYLMKLDQLAAREGDSGLHWFNGIDRLAADVLEPLAVKEAAKVASDLSSTTVPLDIFLMRAHALPLPYLTSPTISFLVHLSPLSYLSLLRTPITNRDVSPRTTLPPLDIPFPIIRSQATSHPRPPGTTSATLVLATTPSPLLPLDPTMQALQGRPSFPLEPEGAKFDSILPEVAEPIDSPEFGKTNRWYLDFTEGGKYRGVVMSQSRMRDIEHLVNPLGTLDDIEPVSVMPVGLGSWVDLIVNPDDGISPGRYTSLYTSPTSSHPPLLLRLTVPDEPGFLLERIPAQSIKQVWGILEIVKEQCWLNEILRGYHWAAEGFNIDQPDESEDVEATEEDLEAVFKGTITPRRIPVNVYITTDLPAIMDDASFNTPRRSKIVMTSPERPPITGLVETSVTYDPSRPRGIAVNISGAMGADLSMDVLEEACRRGGLFGLPGRIWVKAHGYS
ncbi:unnamed protein product [Somion occarium]